MDINSDGLEASHTVLWNGSCGEKPTDELSPLRDDYKVPHYGKFEEDRTKKP
jgi:hypothetical protein